MPAPTNAELIALINLLMSIEHGLMAREDPKFAEMFAHHSKLISASLAGMTSRQLQSAFKDISEGLFTYSDQNYRAAMNTIREHGLEPAFTRFDPHRDRGACRQERRRRSSRPRTRRIGPGASGAAV